MKFVLKYTNLNITVNNKVHFVTNYKIIFKYFKCTLVQYVSEHQNMHTFLRHDKMIYMI